MQIIVNCLLTHEGKGLLLQKPRRNWFVCPGEKAEPYEHVQEAIIREYKEETAITLLSPDLKAVSLNIYQDGERILKQQMIFTFFATKFEGENWDACYEGTLTWIPIENILTQDMALGDRVILTHILNHSGILSGTFIYDAKENLVKHHFSIMNG